jgi:hypothetical protein
MSCSVPSRRSPHKYRHRSFRIFSIMYRRCTRTLKHPLNQGAIWHWDHTAHNPQAQQIPCRSQRHTLHISPRLRDRRFSSTLCCTDTSIHVCQRASARAREMVFALRPAFQLFLPYLPSSFLPVSFKLCACMKPNTDLPNCHRSLHPRKRNHGTGCTAPGSSLPLLRGTCQRNTVCMVQSHLNSYTNPHHKRRSQT